MIIDTIALGASDAYFKFQSNPSTHQDVARIPTSPLGPGMNYKVSGISLLLEGRDLGPHFRKQPKPILSVIVHKEMFPALFASPYKHRVHNIAGYEDFNRGIYKGCKAIDVEGVPTIVSFGDDGTCRWVSPIYKMPTRIAVDKIAWDLAVSRLTPKANFSYSMTLRYWLRNVTPPNEKHYVVIADADPTQLRNNVTVALADKLIAYSIEFTAKIARDSNLYEAYATNPFDSLGTPLLRAVNLLESLDHPAHHFYSLKELLDQCVDCHIFDTPGPHISKITATLALDALLVQSDNQVSSTNHNPALADNYEYIEISIAPSTFGFYQARASIAEMITPPKPMQAP